ncbi:MAG: NAD(P)-dependent oxidoreductase [Prochlorococcaceae cyanobacterium]
MSAADPRPLAVFLDVLTLGPVDLTPLEAHCRLRCWPVSTPDQCLERLQGATVAITNKVPLSGELLRQLPQLRLVCTASTGTDQVDVATCRSLGIAVHNAGAYSRPSVVQVTWSLILALRGGLEERLQQWRAGAWSASPVFALVEPPFDELEGQTLTVLGAGSIGSGVAAVGEALGMRTLRLTSRSSAAELEQALREADVLSLHAPLTAATRGLLNRQRLAWLRPSALLVNTARGALVDTDALAEALRAGRLAGAALDVLPEEPPSAADLAALQTVPNLIVTPHMAWTSRQARQRLVQTLAGHLAALES